MRNEHNSRQLRRYVLGSATDAECDAIEREFFDRAEAADRVSAAEDELIDDYLSGHLDDGERLRFERHYLSTPTHRRRVAVLRALRSAASTAESQRLARVWWTIASVAAALVILVSSVMWVARSRSELTDTQVDRGGQPAAPSPSAAAGRAEHSTPSAPQPEPAPATAPATPVVIAVSISPILVRGDSDAAALTIAEGIDVVRLHLKGQTNEPPFGRGRVIVRTVAAREVWRGPVIEGTRAPEELARVDIPARVLAREDYVVALFGTDAKGREAERHRYFLRVRAR